MASTLTRGELELRDDWPWFIRVGLPMPRGMSITNRVVNGAFLALISEKMSVPSGKGAPEVAVSHVCTKVHTTGAGAMKSCVEDGGTIAAVGRATAAERPRTGSWDRSNTYSP